jgi:C4-type Zn-finger protein
MPEFFAKICPQCGRRYSLEKPYDWVVFRRSVMKNGGNCICGYHWKESELPTLEEAKEINKNYKKAMNDLFEALGWKKKKRWGLF